MFVTAFVYSVFNFILHIFNHLLIIFSNRTPLITKIIKISIPFISDIILQISRLNLNLIIRFICLIIILFYIIRQRLYVSLMAAIKICVKLKALYEVFVSYTSHYWDHLAFISFFFELKIICDKRVIFIPNCK